MKNSQQLLNQKIADLEYRREREKQLIKAHFYDLREGLDVSKLLKQGLSSGLKQASLPSDFKSSLVPMAIASIANFVKNKNSSSKAMSIIGFLFKTGIVSFVVTRLISKWRK